MSKNESGGCGCLIVIILIILAISLCNRINRLEENIDDMKKTEIIK